MLARTDTAGQPAPGRTHGGRTRVRLKRVYHVALLVTTRAVRDWADTVTGTGPGVVPLPPDFC
jgi:hypothetical protein